MKFYVVLSLAKIVAIYAALVCKFVGSKFRSCKFFDKFQVCSVLLHLVASQLCNDRRMYMTQLLLLGKFEYGGGTIFKVVLEC